MELERFAGTLRAHPAIQTLKPILRPIYSLALNIAARILQLRTPYLLRKYDKLHLGSGPHRITGWANIDMTGWRNVIWDLRRRLPIPPGTIRFIYSQHFIEHIPRADALALLKNCKKLLSRGGTIRISTPNLHRAAEDYLAGHIPRLPDTEWYPATPCVAINEAMRLWGHQFVYDADELTRLLKEAGFSDIRSMQWGESGHPELRGLETRPYYDDLIFEAS
jgi:predicted SAM-dependent methyltransferase